MSGYRNVSGSHFFHSGSEQLNRYRECLNWLFSYGGHCFPLPSKWGGNWNWNIHSFQILHKCSFLCQASPGTIRQIEHALCAPQDFFQVCIIVLTSRAIIISPFWIVNYMRARISFVYLCISNPHRAILPRTGIQ